MKPLPLIRDDTSEMSDDDEDVAHASAVPHMRTNEKTFQASKAKAKGIGNTVNAVKELSKEIDMFSKLISSLWNKYLTALANDSANATRVFRTEHDETVEKAFSCFVFPLRLESEYPKVARIEEFKRLVYNFPVIFHRRGRYRTRCLCGR